MRVNQNQNKEKIWKLLKVLLLKHLCCLHFVCLFQKENQKKKAGEASAAEEAAVADGAEALATALRVANQQSTQAAASAHDAKAAGVSVF